MATLALASAACGAERTYTAAPIQARVVDSENGAPIEGVNVVAAWEAKGGLEGGNVMGYVTVMEDVSNANGEFSFPGWGPKTWRNGAIRNGAPLLILFKPGYDVELLREWKYGLEWAPSQMSSSWDGKSLRLKAFHGTLNEYSRQLAMLSINTESIVRDGCMWKTIPRFLAAFIHQSDLLIARGAPPLGLSSLSALAELADEKCGSLKGYVLEQKK